MITGSDLIAQVIEIYTKNIQKNRKKVIVETVNKYEMNIY